MERSTSGEGEFWRASERGLLNLHPCYKPRDLIEISLSATRWIRHSHGRSLSGVIYYIHLSLSICHFFQAIVFRVAKGPFIEDFYQCVTHGFYTERWQEQAYTTLSLVFMFILPLVILVSTYVSTIRTIARKYFIHF